jgi:hypothetical protein
MTKRKSAQGLLLAIINVAVILGVTLVIQSLAAEDPAPRSVSLDLPAESEFALPSPIEERLAFASRGSSSAATAAPSSPTGQAASDEIVATTTIGAQESPALGTAGLDELWDLWQDQSNSAQSPFTADSESGAPPGISVSGYLSSSNAPAFGRRSGLSTGYAGMGGGFSGAGGRSPGNSRNSQSLANSSAGLQSSSDLTASPAGGPSLPIQAQGNPSFGGPLFPLAQFPGVGSGVGTSPILQNGGGGTSANVTQEPVQVPEPSTALLLGCALALATFRKRRRLNLTN